MSDNKIEEKEKPKTDYKVLVEQLLLLSAEFGACQDFLDELNTITDKRTFKRVLERNFEEIANKLTIDIEDSYKIDNLEEEVDDLKSEVYNLEQELDDYKQLRNHQTLTLTDEYKIQHFINHKNNYAEWEMQFLFENGRKLLQQNTIN